MEDTPPGAVIPSLSVGSEGLLHSKCAEGFQTRVFTSPLRHSMCSAHVSAPIRPNVTDTPSRAASAERQEIKPRLCREERVAYSWLQNFEKEEVTVIGK